MHGRPYALIGSASADISHRFVDVPVGWFRRSFEQRGCRHDLTGLAIAALRDVDRRPRFLYGMRAGGGEALDGGDPIGSFHVFDPDGTRALHLVIDMHGAGAALRDPAAVFGAGEADLLADDPQERGICLHFHVAHAAVDVELRHERPLASWLRVFFRFSHASAAEQRPKNEITWQAALKDTASRMLLHQPCFGQACFDQKRRDELPSNYLGQAWSCRQPCPARRERNWSK